MRRHYSTLCWLFLHIWLSYRQHRNLRLQNEKWPPQYRVSTLSCVHRVLHCSFRPRTIIHLDGLSNATLTDGSQTLNVTLFRCDIFRGALSSVLFVSFLKIFSRYHLFIHFFVKLTSLGVALVPPWHHILLHSVFHYCCIYVHILQFICWLLCFSGNTFYVLYTA